MKPVRPTLIVAVCAALLLGQLQPLAAQQPPATAQATQPTQATQTTQTPAPQPPDNVDRIREALKRPPALKVENGQVRIYVEVIATWPNFAEVLKHTDLINGPTGKSGHAMSHQEFLGIVTPREMAGSGGVQAGEILTMAAVNYVGQLLIKKAVKAVGEGRADKKLTAIQAQIDRELAALRGGR